MPPDDASTPNARGVDRIKSRAESAEAAPVRGDDLVPVKEKIVEDALAKLGLSFTTKPSRRVRPVHLGAIEQGQVTAGRFEIRERAGRRGPGTMMALARP